MQPLDCDSSTVDRYQKVDKKFARDEGASRSDDLKMKLTTVPANEYGVFYEGDSYLLLRTFGTRALSWNIHMWIGKDSSADEQCTCVYKSIELDELLNWKAIQYRETQNHESKQFLSYFKRGIR
ncbi:unnamed protein product [Toxocara canis]|uniref:Macrophage-capping protein n=1 Tax=Toxocara canis TaxID=6265 RepID=A0A183UCD1_TOXCA|nr:unnamed protein product [Toxocara canis]